MTFEYEINMYEKQNRHLSSIEEKFRSLQEKQTDIKKKRKQRKST
jgi:hypothetical protein